MKVTTINVSDATRTTPARVITETCGLRICVESNDSALLDDAIPWLPEGWRPSDGAALCDRRYSVRTALPDDVPALVHYAFDVDEAESRQSSDFGVFCDMLENDLHHYIATYTRGPIFVHAGVAVWQGQAIVIPGRSFAGKSTLTEALLNAGATYYSDDYAPIDESGLVHPFPRHLRLRNRGDRFAQNRVDPFDEGWPVGNTVVPIGIVARLKFDREAGWNVQETSRGAGVLALLNNTVAARERPVDAMAIMASAVEHAIVLEGTRGEADDAAKRLLERLADLPT